MIDLHLLEQLIIVNDCGTLSKASKQLLISQPGLTRSMQRLEDFLGVQLFERTKNKMVLNPTGYYTVAQARQLLQQAGEFVNKVHHHALQQLVSFIGSCAPGPIHKIDHHVKTHMANQKITTRIEDEESLEQNLLSGDYQLIITSKPIIDPRIISQLYFTEDLYLSVPKDHPLSTREFVSLDDLAGLTMIVRTDLGIWNDFVAKLTATNFITQSDLKSFIALVEASNMPCFSSNISPLVWDSPKDRVDIPIKDKAASISFYMNTLKKHRLLLEQLIQ